MPCNTGTCCGRVAPKQLAVLQALLPHREGHALPTRGVQPPSWHSVASLGDDHVGPCTTSRKAKCLPGRRRRTFGTGRCPFPKHSPRIFFWWLSETDRRAAWPGTHSPTSIAPCSPRRDRSSRTRRGSRRPPRAIAWVRV